MARSICEKRTGFRGKALLLVVAVLSTGCQRPLFPADAPRTQFDLQDQIRGRSVPMEEPDPFGRPQPALRARLTRHN